MSKDLEAGPGAAETHTVVGAQWVEGVGTAHKKGGLVPQEQHLYKVSTLALGWGGKREVWSCWVAGGWGGARQCCGPQWGGGPGQRRTRTEVETYRAGPCVGVSRSQHHQGRGTARIGRDGAWPYLLSIRGH